MVAYKLVVTSDGRLFYTDRIPPFRWPFPIGTAGDEFGPRPPLPFHNGIDFPQPEGTPVQPVGRGTVSLVLVADSELGNYVRIDHGTVNGVRLQTGYAHFQFPANWSVGDTITEADFVGRVGNTGFSFGPHLHLETWEDNVRIDPRIWMQKYAGNEGGTPVDV
jgi:murein DD-endopeptidase MepM/ murein hydrolase activator NlpD